MSNVSTSTSDVHQHITESFSSVAPWTPMPSWI